MDERRLGRTGLELSAIGFGAFKIGRNQGIRYARPYPLPDEPAAARLLNGVLDLGISYIDTAPAYGLSEERIGAAIGHRRDEFRISTKVGEEFADGRSTYDFSPAAVRRSVERSLRRLRTDVLDLVLIHSDGRDAEILAGSGAPEALLGLRDEGKIRAVGFSGKTVEGARAALSWADALMVTYHLEDTSHEAVIAEAAVRGVGVIVKKGLASGSLDADRAVSFVLKNVAVTSLVIGTRNLDHLRRNLETASAVTTRPKRS